MTEPNPPAKNGRSGRGPLGAAPCSIDGETI